MCGFCGGFIISLLKVVSELGDFLIFFSDFSFVLSIIWICLVTLANLEFDSCTLRAVERKA